VLARRDEMGSRFGQLLDFGLGYFSGLVFHSVADVACAFNARDEFAVCVR
jgi:hypothetical protein